MNYKARELRVGNYKKGVETQTEHNVLLDFLLTNSLARHSLSKLLAMSRVSLFVGGIILSAQIRM